ncbi:8-oxo-dGTP diphosphatase MutT [Phosphitispora fastidiosa]|uniref:8-oxo-dGTP diphosphatase MutT n=1 Tax=Phosphitispora fastidiosa TaxID=2837202 RepID=UPI001E305B9A|nr:8-oxo-dGTP diphosphatase MutT [Phosphitispora fastidiosa]MBU7006740.1 8-oxo-dGTP diphosphatase [Phosphitispora fastidiosa]
MKILVVTAAIIENNGKFLIAQRKKGSHQGMKWEFPGGKVEQGEDPEACLIREIKEELDINVEVGDIFKVVSHIYEDRQVILLCYLCSLKGGQPSCIDCQDWKWADPEEMMGYEFAPADIPVVRKLLGQ